MARNRNYRVVATVVDHKDNQLRHATLDIKVRGSAATIAFCREDGRPAELEITCECQVEIMHWLSEHLATSTALGAL